MSAWGWFVLGVICGVTCATVVFVILLAGWEIRRPVICSDDPACPDCGSTARVEPSRKQPGRFMCHGCARYFDAPAAEQP